ncbi:MAG: hypothetical protein HY860_05110 [Chlamydiales bacterium]|nr:hypothetical protein [Chlamydiales bacterium]
MQKKLLIASTTIGMWAAACHGLLTVNGNFNLKDATVFSTIVIEKTGKIEGIRSILFGLMVKGDVTLEACTVKREVHVEGTLSALDTKFLKDMIIRSGNVVLTSCSLPSLYIDNANSEPLIVELKDSTEINGSITFQKGNGLVYVASDVIIHGDVIGGSILELSNP